MADDLFDVERTGKLATTAGEKYRATFAETMRVRNLARLPIPENYHPDAPPELNGERRIILNTETTGLRWWEDDRPIGWSWWLPESGRHGYMPMRHRPGGNLSIEQVHEWQRRELSGVHVDNINTKFDLHMSRADGVDLTEIAASFGDVAHHAALLDDHRMRFSLDLLSRDILGWDVDADKKPDCIANEKEFQDLHPSMVAPYAIRNVEQVHRLLEAFAPDIENENLERVLALEQDVIPVVVEMEKNGTYLDMALLESWRESVKAKRQDIQMRIYKETGIRLESFDSSKEMSRLFEKRGIPITAFTEALDEEGQHSTPSFTDAVMRGTNDPVIALAREGGQLADLESKYLNKYSATVRGDGWMRFNLHQLRTGRDANEKRGTISGRFSAAGDREGGYNPQQVVAVEKQLERGWCPDYVVRKLFVPGPGEACWLSSDMDQVEYRLFAHYANDPLVLAAYNAPPPHRTAIIGGKQVFLTGPHADFHAVVMELLHQVNPNLNRKLTKNINFAKIYGAKLLKFALMIGTITEAVWKELNERFRGAIAHKDWQTVREIYADPRLQTARELESAYNRMFPAVEPLLKRASLVAQERGYVMTLMGRRARLTERYHASLNRIIQGGAADINKRVLVEVYRARKALGLVMRLTVHDEVCCGLRDAAMVNDVDKLLNTQYFDLRVPILWSTATGKNWAECK